ncbi:heavy metal-responsive transcriptional regulator [Thiohalobacter sp. IOR34]|uniref:heavy metal-responsive transcriptional regulator n=1 Tax=Thiohalobacter sp. IOR34 TaxID=3057176 RepID=UPI0025AEDB93|nr:heavy metal-responsive transcriptional regulator [Thiohalobacter sp. IOR34]WJW76434.1 heavy metal-responsive transcriptional regulator [Thiohalobacter sp. IOR34]
MSISSSSNTERIPESPKSGKDSGKSRYRIGDVVHLTGLSADTLRYYEKIKLLPPVNRSASGIRFYDARDLSRLRFIQRAKSMNFSLDEIARLLEMRENPQHARDDVRELTHRKLREIEVHMEELQTLRNELTLLVNLCRGTNEGCPIIENLDGRQGRNKT